MGQSSHCICLRWFFCTRISSSLFGGLMQWAFFLTIAIFRLCDMVQIFLQLCRWCFDLHITQLSWTSSMYDSTLNFLLLSYFQSPSRAIFINTWVCKSLNSNNSVYDGTSFWSSVWFCHKNIKHCSNFSSMSYNINISSKSYFSASNALMCCLTTSCKWCSSSLLPFFSENASKIAQMWAWWINRHVSYRSWRRSKASL